MTDEQQQNLLNKVQHTLNKHAEVGEAFNNKESEDAIIRDYEVSRYINQFL